MNELIKKVTKLQDGLGYAHTRVDFEAKIAYLRELCLALHVEVDEFLNELPWKPWKPVKAQGYDPEKAAEEIIDILIFCLDLWVILGRGVHDDTLLKQMALEKIAVRTASITHEAYGNQERT